MDLSVFSRGYAEARSKFLEAATRRGARVRHWLSREAAPIRDEMRNHFYPPFDDWKKMLLFRSNQVYRQALAGLAST
jgi:hypothetical protein